MFLPFYFFTFLLFIKLIPLLHSLLPVGLLTAGDGILLLFCLIACLISCTLSLHRLDGGIVENLDGATLDGILQFLLAESLARLIEVRDVEFIIHAKVVAYQFLLQTVAGILQAQQLSDFLDFSC